MRATTYSVKSEDLLCWFAANPSITIRIEDGNRLVLDSGDGQIVILKNDAEKAASEARWAEIMKSEGKPGSDSVAVIDAPAPGREGASPASVSGRRG